MLPSDFPKKPIAAGMLVALYGATALAQDTGVEADEVTSEQELEEVVVTGIRYSLKRSLTSSAMTAGSLTQLPQKTWARSRTQTSPNRCSALRVSQLRESAERESTSQ